MRIGLLCWNPFQIEMFTSITQAADATFIIERRGDELFNRIFPEQTLKSLPGTMQFVKRSQIRGLDGQFDIILFQTPFRDIEYFQRSKLVSLQYSMAKERHQYGPWRALCDLSLVFGHYSFERISPFCPAERIGNPRFDNWTEGRLLNLPVDLQKRLDPAKKTILYLPTWGKLSSIAGYLEEILRLQEQYNVIGKLHHNTIAFREDHLHLTNEFGLKKSIFVDSISTIDLLKMSDLVISDYSGAIFDALYVGRPVVLLQDDPHRLIGKNNFGLESIEYTHREKIGPVVTKPTDIGEVVAKVFNGDISYLTENDALRARCFDFHNNSGERAVNAMKRLLAGEFMRPNYQLYIRDAVRRELQTIGKIRQQEADGRRKWYYPLVRYVSKKISGGPKPEK